MGKSFWETAAALAGRLRRAASRSPFHNRNLTRPRSLIKESNEWAAQGAHAFRISARRSPAIVHLAMAALCVSSRLRGGGPAGALARRANDSGRQI